MKDVGRRARGKGHGTLERKPNGIYLARWIVDGKKYSRSTGTTDKYEAEKILANFVKPFQSKSRIKRLENLIDELKREQSNLNVEENNIDKDKDKNKNKNKNNKKEVKENNMNSKNDTRNYILNKTFVTVSWLAASFILLHKHLYFLFVWYSAFFILFPMAYVFLKFSISDCINKPYIIDKGVDENIIMLFSDKRKNIRVTEFISREMLNANFWIIIASMITACVGLFWK